MFGDHYAETKVEKWLEKAGVVTGEDFVVHNPTLFRRVLGGGRLALGEAYMDGWWDSPHLDQFFEKLLRARIHTEIKFDVGIVSVTALALLINMQNRWRASVVAKDHYDLDRRLYEAMLGGRLVYSCGYYGRGATTLDQAQLDKLRLIADKLKLEPGMRVLDIGCGWGELAHLLATEYDVSVVGVNLSEEQVAYAKERFDDPRLTFRLQDYRAVDDGPYDRIVSVGFMEHVGYKNYRAYFEKVSELLTPQGLTLLHTIGSNRTTRAGDPWSNKYIFPNGMLPSIAQLGRATESLLVMEDWQNFGSDYARTLMSWQENVEAAWPELADICDARFQRMWHYYLNYFAGAFRARYINLWQVVLSKERFERYDASR